MRSQSSSSEDGSSNENEKGVTVAQNIPNGDEVLGGNNTFSQNSRTEETINYEISKVVRNKVRNTGIIKRLTVAVMVDGIYEKDSEGKQVYRERSKAEMEQLTALVRSAVGYDADRGDMVEVENMRFVSVETAPEEKEPVIFLGFTKSEVMRMLEGLGVAIVAILVILLVIRPLINNAFDTGSGSDSRLLGDNADEENLLLSNFLNDKEDGLEELININKIEGRVKVSSLKKINDLVAKNPDAAVNVIRGWLYQNDN